MPPHCTVNCRQGQKTGVQKKRSEFPNHSKTHPAWLVACSITDFSRASLDRPASRRNSISSRRKERLHNHRWEQRRSRCRSLIRSSCCIRRTASSAVHRELWEPSIRKQEQQRRIRKRQPIHIRMRRQQPLLRHRRELGSKQSRGLACRWCVEHIW